jgi:hypothetical protein
MVSQYNHHTLKQVFQQKKIYLFYGVPFYKTLSRESTSISLLLSQLKVSLLLTQTQVEEAKILVHYTAGALTCDIRMMMKADCEHTGLI